jgi:hypothetical protein
MADLHFQAKFIAMLAEENLSSSKELAAATFCHLAWRDIARYVQGRGAGAWKF